MVDMDESQFSLMGLEEELTCSICLNTFDCPVTLPCGHNFCQSCLLSHWEDSYSCPQCRTLFPDRPELKKNTVLSTVVQTFSLKWNKTEAEEVAEESEEEKDEDVIRCDTCMEAEAAKTCLTCMASFCEEHLRPHHENPKFSVHELCEPSRDMSERLCQDHQKLIEFFCSEHNRPICSQCLQQVHRQCPFISPEEQRNHKQSDFKEKLGLLEVKIERTETVLFYMKDMQSKLKDASVTRKTALAALYQQMRDLLVSEEREAQHEVDREHEVCQTKLQDLMKRFTENSGNMKKAREDVNSLLSQSQTMAFLQASYEMPRVVNFDPHPPRVNLDSKRVTATQACAAALKEHLTELLKQPVEARLMTLKPDEIPAPVTESESSASAEPKPGPPEPPRSHNPVSPPIQHIYQTVPVPVYIHSPRPHWNPPQYAHSSGPHKGPVKGGQKTGGGQSGGGKQGGGHPGGGKPGGGHPGGGKPGGGKQGGGHPGGGKPGGGKQGGGHPGGGKPSGGKPGGGKPSSKGQPQSGKSQPHKK